MNVIVSRTTTVIGFFQTAAKAAKQCGLAIVLILFPNALLMWSAMIRKSECRNVFVSITFVTTADHFSDLLSLSPHNRDII